MARIASHVHAWLFVTTGLPSFFSILSITDTLRPLLHGMYTIDI
jgi:hypothetical protein